MFNVSETPILIPTKDINEYLVDYELYSVTAVATWTILRGQFNVLCMIVKKKKKSELY